MTVLNAKLLGGLDYLKKSVREALEWEGEAAVYYQMYNSQNAAGIARCAHCFNPAYAQSDYQGTEEACPYCFGTTYEGGIKQAFFTPVLVSKPEIRDDHASYGDLAEKTANLYLPDFIPAWKGDFLVRINGFDLVSENPLKTTPAVVEAFQIETPQVSIVKDGLSQIGFKQKIGSSARASLVNIDHPITKVVMQAPSLSLFAPTPKQGPLLNVVFSQGGEVEDGS